MFAVLNQRLNDEYRVLLQLYEDVGLDATAFKVHWSSAQADSCAATQQPSHGATVSSKSPDAAARNSAGSGDALSEASADAKSAPDGDSQKPLAVASSRASVVSLTEPSSTGSVTGAKGHRRHRSAMANSVGVTKIHESMRLMRAELIAVGKAAMDVSNTADGQEDGEDDTAGKHRRGTSTASRVSETQRQRDLRELAMREDFTARGLEPADFEMFKGVWYLLERKAKEIDHSREACPRWWGACYHSCCDSACCNSTRRTYARGTGWCGRGCCCPRWKHWDRLLLWLKPPAHYISTVSAPVGAASINGLSHGATPCNSQLCMIFVFLHPVLLRGQLEMFHCATVASARQLERKTTLADAAVFQCTVWQPDASCVVPEHLVRNRRAHAHAASGGRRLRFLDSGHRARFVWFSPLHGHYRCVVCNLAESAPGIFLVLRYAWTFRPYSTELVARYGVLVGCDPLQERALLGRR